MDPCKCWKTTQITVSVQHCPSEETEIRKEVDRIILFTMKETGLTRFGKVTIGMLEKVEETK